MTKIESIKKEIGGQQKLEKALKANLNWIVKSFEATGLKGSSGSSTVYGQWGPAYPETTGYLIPTLIAAHSYHPNAKETALKQLDYLKSIQNADGSFKLSGTEDTPLVFDTSQVMFGLIALAGQGDNSGPTLKMLREAINWLRSQLDFKGHFKAHNYVEGYQPSYYARIAWALAASECIIQSKVSGPCKQLINRILDNRTEHLSYMDCGFYKDETPTTHTIAYTLRGLWECAEIMNSKSIKKSTGLSLEKLAKVIMKNGKVAGSYNDKWEGDYSYICSTGNAQLALLYLVVYKSTGYTRFLDPIPTLIQPLLESQRRVSLNVGAIPSSIPIWGPYQKMKFTNWTQKFFSDFLLLVLKC